MTQGARPQAAHDIEHLHYGLALDHRPPGLAVNVGDQHAPRFWRWRAISRWYRRSAGGMNDWRISPAYVNVAGQ